MSSLDRSNCEYYNSIKAITQVKSLGLEKKSNKKIATQIKKYTFAYFKGGKSWTKREIKGWDFGSCT